MYALSLQSGSNGNCIYVETSGARLLFDAGISGVQAEQRLRSAGRDIRDVDCVFISHDHADHVRCAGVLSRKFGLEVRITPKTYEASRPRGAGGRLERLEHFHPGDAVSVNGTRVETVPTPHDGVDGVAFVIDDGTSRLGILTDLGHVFSGLGSLVESLDGVFLESNYDTVMLDSGPYPAFLKKRIKGAGGHISNDEAAGLLSGAFAAGLKWACLAHLSEHNNSPGVAVDTHRAVLGPSVQLGVASRYVVSPLFSL